MSYLVVFYVLYLLAAQEQIELVLRRSIIFVTQAFQSYTFAFYELLTFTMLFTAEALYIYFSDLGYAKDVILF